MGCRPAGGEIENRQPSMPQVDRRRVPTNQLNTAGVRAPVPQTRDHPLDNGSPRPPALRAQWRTTITASARS